MHVWDVSCISWLDAFLPPTGNPRASDHAPGGGTIGSGPHIH